jgi:type II restriction/modification system DNA methylase subunit YeeA
VKIASIFYLLVLSYDVAPTFETEVCSPTDTFDYIYGLFGLTYFLAHAKEFMPIYKLLCIIISFSR